MAPSEFSGVESLNFYENHIKTSPGIHARVRSRVHARAHVCRYKNSTM